MFSSIPAEVGTYCLHLKLNFPRRIKIGKLGEYNFPAGDYSYVGSALGSGGLRARMGRHLRGDGRRHWHIDWLRAESAVTGYFSLVSSLRLECLWSQALMKFPDVSVPVPGFGASDCKDSYNPCPAHLVWLKPGRHPKKIQEILSLASGEEVSYRNFTSDSQSELGYIE